MATDESNQQAERLAELRSREREILALRERESDLEVERIAAQTALARARSQAPPDMDAEAAARLAGLLARRHELEDAVAGLDERLVADTGAGPRERLEAGVQALESWLVTPGADEGTGFRQAVQAVLLVVTVAVIWAALAIHVAFLLILVAVVGPVSFVLSRGQDDAWRRLGARKRFETTGLAPPADWDEAAVRARYDALLHDLEAAADREPIPESRAKSLREERTALMDELEEQQAGLEAAMQEAGLDADDLDADTENWLLLLARAERARRDLERSARERKNASAHADELREALYRYLSRQGETPGDGKADSDTLAAGLERIKRKGDGFIFPKEK